ncbi:MAG: hypothetical protein BWK80_43425 [Desulfobacteraceae bacterium IS3]|nr:MAG: hypothetical protein BWK80_43425 [Desulfobacteraceae bacterium IS3]
MQHINSFGEVLEAADKLSPEDQETLIDILSRRVADYRRAELIKNIEEARKEFREGRCKVATPDEIMKEILS